MTTNFLILSFFIFTISLISHSTPGNSLSSCNGPCNSLNDCAGQLICINRKCNDDPQVGTRICSSSGTLSVGTCQPSGTFNCDGISQPIYSCSPPVTSSTPAMLTLNNFSEGGDGGFASSCDERFHENSELVVALSTGWYAGGSRCGQMVRIEASNGQSTLAKVVDECDSMNGCDAEHAGQQPCHNNIVDGSEAVWNALGLTMDIGDPVPVTWSMA